MRVPSKKKLLVVIPSPISFYIFLKELVDRLIVEGFEVHVACKKYEQFDRLDGVTYHFIKFDRNVSLIGALSASKELRKLVKAITPDVIHSHFSSSAFITFLARSSGWPVSVATIQGAISTSGIPLSRRLLYFIAEILSFRSFSRTYVLSEDDFVKLAPFIPSLKVQKSIGFGCNLDVFNRNRVGRYSRNDLSIGHGDFVIIYVGRMVAFKGFPIVIRTFQALEAKFSNVKLIVCGQPDAIHPSGLSFMEETYFKTNPNIIKTGFTKDVFAYLSLADINFFPSTREGMPVNLMESIACGVPVVASSSRGCRHIVHDGVDGLVVDKHNVDAYVNSIEALILNRDRLHEFRKNCGHSRVLFNRNNYVDETVTVYNELMNLKNVTKG